MTSPLPLPDWVPWWVHFVLLLAMALFVLVYLAMPFSVFGVKARLENLEAHLDEIQGELRNLALRLAEAPEPPLYERADERGFEAGDDPYVQPPAPPRAGLYGRPEPRIVRPQGRTEPRLY